MKNNYSESEEISPEDLEAASDYYDKCLPPRKQIFYPGDYAKIVHSGPKYKVLKVDWALAIGVEWVQLDRLLDRKTNRTWNASKLIKVELEDSTDEAEEFIKKLPQGSGFDCVWTHIKTQGNGVEVFETYFHNMNPNGYYDGYTRLRLKVYLHKPEDFRLGCVGGTRYIETSRDYWEDTILYAVTEDRKEVKSS